MMLLTPRQREVLDLMVLGMSTTEIAGKLWVSRNTARNHIQQILDKLDVHTRIAAVHVANVWVDSPGDRVVEWCRSQRMHLDTGQESAMRAVFGHCELDCHRSPTREG
jgi:DNA-binding CsgD family transcriptional regulator